MTRVLWLTLILWLPLSTVTAQPVPAEVLQRIEASLGEPDGTHRTAPWELSAGPVSPRFEPGLVTTAGRNGTGCREMLFDGRGILELSTDDPVEAGQLELFTGP